MSTRAAIGRADGDSFEARYHHSDGYPTGLGRLFQQRALAAHDLEAFIRYIVDEHPGGWSSLWDTPEDDHCYCHNGQEGASAEPYITDCDLFIEWAYAIEPVSRRLGVWVSCEDPSRDHVRPGVPGAVSDYVEPGYRGVLVAVLDLDDTDIGWEEIERRGHALKEEYGRRADLVTDRLYDASWRVALR